MAVTKYNHVEAFCLMLYRDAAGNEEWIWNSRDGVTPYGVASRQGLEALHVEWSRDRRLPEYVPAIGDRIFVDLTIERARELRRAYVEQWWTHGKGESKMSSRFASKGDAVEQLALSDLEYGGGGAPDLIEVTAEVLSRITKRAAVVTPVDLDEMERQAKADALRLDGLHGDPAKLGSWIGHRDYARRTVALIARIRELEAGLTELLDELVQSSEDPDGDYGDMRALVAKGVVLP